MLKRYNKATKQFEDYTEDTTEIKLFEQLSKDGVFVEYSSKGVFIKSEDLLKANISKGKVLL